MMTRQQRRAAEREAAKNPVINRSQAPMDREQRRRHIKENKNNPSAIYCPRCNAKTRHVALPVGIYNDPKKAKETECNIVCSACGHVLRSRITGVTPYEYVKETPPV